MTNPNFAMRIVDGKKVGLLRTRTATYYLHGDGVLTINSAKTSTLSRCGVFRNGSLEEIPKKYVAEVSKVLEKLTYMHSVLQAGA